MVFVINPIVTTHIPFVKVIFATTSIRRWAEFVVIGHAVSVTVAKNVCTLIGFRNVNNVTSSVNTEYRLTAR